MVYAITEGTKKILTRIINDCNQVNATGGGLHGAYNYRPPSVATLKPFRIEWFEKTQQYVVYVPPGALNLGSFTCLNTAVSDRGLYWYAIPKLDTSTTCAVYAHVKPTIYDSSTTSPTSSSSTSVTTKIGIYVEMHEYNDGTGSTSASELEDRAVVKTAKAGDSVYQRIGNVQEATDSNNATTRTITQMFTGVILAPAIDTKPLYPYWRVDTSGTNLQFKPGVNSATVTLGGRLFTVTSPLDLNFEVSLVYLCIQETTVSSVATLSSTLVCNPTDISSNTKLYILVHSFDAYGQDYQDSRVTLYSTPFYP